MELLNTREDFYKELDMIQSCINRMAQNSFQMKAWCVAVNMGFIAFMSKESGLFLTTCVVILVSLFIFWMLDAFYLHTERKYRKMYEDVLQKRPVDDLSNQFDLNPSRYANQVECYCKVMFSSTLRKFYGVFVLLDVIVILFKLISDSKEFVRDLICG